MKTKTISWKPNVHEISAGWPGKPETRQARLELHLIVNGANTGVQISVHADDPTRGTLQSLGSVSMGYVPASAFGGERQGGVGELAAFAEDAVANGRIWVVDRAMTQDEKDDSDLTR